MLEAKNIILKLEKWRSQFHQSCVMFLLIHSLMNGALKDTIYPSSALPNSNGFSIIIVFFFIIIGYKDSNHLFCKKLFSKNFITN